MVDAVPARCFEDSEEKNFEVEEERTVVDVPDIQAKLLFPRKGVASVDLGPAGDARTDFVAARLFGRIAWKVSHGERARADEGHFAGKDVQKLWQLV